jgi:hypothetical protein
MQNAAANNIAAQVNPNDALNSGFYQQLLAQMQQNSQTISPPSELASNINNDLIQQLTSSLLAVSFNLTHLILFLELFYSASVGQSSTKQRIFYESKSGPAIWHD